MSAPVRKAHDWLWVAGSFAMMGAAQFITQVLLGRVLGAGAYGQAATLVAAMNAVGIPLVGVQLITTALVARGSSAAATVQRYGLLAVAACVALFLAAPLWSAAIAVGDVGACRAASLYVVAAMALALARGIVVGLGRTRVLATGIACGALARVAVAPLAAAHFGVAGAVAGLIVGELTAACVIAAVVKFPGAPAPAAHLRGVTGATMSQMAMWVTVNIDMLWAARLLSPVDTGRYLFAASVGMGFVSVGQAFLWHSGSQINSQAKALSVAGRSALIVGATSLLGVPVIAVVAPLVLGGEFSNMGALFAVVGFGSVFAAATTAGTMALVMATERPLKRLGFCLVLVASPPVFIALLGPSAVHLAFAAVFDAAVGAAVVWGPAARSGRLSDETPGSDTFEDAVEALEES